MDDLRRQAELVILKAKAFDMLMGKIQDTEQFCGYYYTLPSYTPVLPRMADAIPDMASMNCVRNVKYKWELFVHTPDNGKRPDLQTVLLDEAATALRKENAHG